MCWSACWLYWLTLNINISKYTCCLLKTVTQTIVSTLQTLQVPSAPDNVAFTVIGQTVLRAGFLIRPVSTEGGGCSCMETDHMFDKLVFLECIAPSGKRRVCFYIYQDMNEKSRSPTQCDLTSGHYVSLHENNDTIIRCVTTVIERVSHSSWQR